MPGKNTKWNVNSIIAGAGGGLVASIATCPLDVIKTKLQAQTTARGHAGYQGVYDTLITILKRDSIRGLYRGLGPTILGYLPTWAIYFSVYDGIKTRFGEAPLGGAVARPPTHAASASSRSHRIYPAAHPKGYQPSMRDHPWSLHILSAMTAGACSTICTNPLWVIKTRFMTQPPTERRYKHTLDAFLTIYRTEGPRAFYRGLLPSLLGIAHVAVQFPLYEQLRAWAQSHTSQTPLTTPTILLCSAISKMTASIATYPHEVVRTRLQIQRRFLGPRTLPATATASPSSSTPISSTASPSPSRSHTETQTQHQSQNPHHTPHRTPNRTRAHYRGIIQTAGRIVREEGWRGLYKGLSINLFRTVPNSAVTMLTYEMLMRHLSAREWDRDGDD